MTGPLPGRVAFVLKGYPRLSETFIAQEIAALERRGLEILIVSLRHPTDARRHPVHDEIRASILYLPEYLLLEPLRVMRAWLRERKNSRYRETRNLWLRDLLRDPTPNRVRRFGQALVLANELPQDVKRLHAHFLHTPASVARYAALLTGLAWTGSAISASSARANSAGEPGATSNPVRPSSTSSGIPETFVATQASPWLCASASTLGRPSRSPSRATREASANRSAAR